MAESRTERGTLSEDKRVEGEGPSDEPLREDVVEPAASADDARGDRASPKT